MIPPKEMQKEYFERLEAADLAEEKPLREHPKDVASRFDERKKWYGKQFPGLEAALLASAEFEVGRAKALVKSAGIRVFKRSKLAKEALAPAQEMLEQAKALAEESKNIDKDPETPYLKEMKRAKDAGDAYRVYLKARRKNLDSSAFYLDVADHFIELKRKDLALRVLSNIAEMNLESAPLLRILGHRLLQIGEAELAAIVFEEVLEIREEEPQSYRDLALAKMALGENKRAAELLWEVASRPWDDRFEAVDQIALAELNRLIAREGDSVKPGGMDDALGYAMPADLRVILTWDADNTDIDLWVIDPSGEVCKYDHSRTVTGGRMSNDFTQGYGPEEFVIKDALPGEYIIKANYYGNSQQTLAGATTIQAEIFTDYGRSSEDSKSITLRLRDKEDVVEVGRVNLGE